MKIDIIEISNWPQAFAGATQVLAFAIIVVALCIAVSGSKFPWED